MATAITITPPPAVKQIVAKTGTFTAVTGTLLETQTGSILIPADTITSTELLELTARISKSGTAGSLSGRVFINSTNDLIGANTIAYFTTMSAATQTAQLNRTFDNPDGASISYLRLSSGAFTDSAADTNGLINLGVDWKSDQYIILTISNGSTADSSIGELIDLKIFK